MTNKIDLHNIDIADFMKTVNSCKGPVYMVTDDENCLNLKSKLCQLIGLSDLIKGGILTEVSVRCLNTEDETKLFRFNLYKEVPQK